MMEQVMNVMQRHPRLRVTFAHFLFLSEHPEMLEELFAKYPSMAVDVTPGTEMYSVFTERHDFYRVFFEKYADRILFGTDAGIPKYENVDLVESVYRAMTEEGEVEIWKLPARGLQLSEEACRLILSENFLRRSGAQPKPVNREALKRYVQKYSHLMQNQQTKEQILRIFHE
jgi:predicted TIM-barrel fold metal-dependent hydrolase